MVLIAASGFLANPRPPNEKYVSQLEHLVQARFVVLSDLKVWLFHASSFPQSRVPYQPGGFQTAPLLLLAALE
jgi:hypothetical protein